MKLPIQATPIMRYATTASLAIRGVTPQGCGPWLGRAPSCAGSCNLCEPGQTCQTDVKGDGARCLTGQKVRCCD